MNFYTVDNSYVQELHAIDSEVFYDAVNYQNKPYVGIVIQNGSYDYFIPLTSAKNKHKKWKNVTDTNYVIYELLPKHIKMPSTAICVTSKSNIKHILAVLEIKKMIPVPKKYCSKINFKTIIDTSYRDLFLKEYKFLKPLETVICKKALSIYQQQINSGIILPFHCNYSKLEQVYDKYKSTSKSLQTV